MHTFINRLASFHRFPLFFNAFKWLALALVVGILAGSASAFFLISLHEITQWRESHLWVIALLPLGGLLIGLSYHYWGSSVVKGNNLLLEEFHSPKQIIPFRMAPLVLFGTLLTHAVGGSAGREGTAVQMGGAIADQFTKIFRLKNLDRQILLIMGISAGFASVFGTPLAGAVFALEVLILVGRLRYMALLPSLLAAFVADFTCHAWAVEHTTYSIPWVPAMSLSLFLWTLLAGMLFGLAAWLFSQFVHFWSRTFQRFIIYPPLRPVLGGAVLALVFWTTDTSRYMGLGIPTILEAFSQPLSEWTFLLKTLFTSFTLGAGFKGGEVTPLFFVGATLGNALANFIPLPVALLAGMGFVAVFSGATNTPIACTLMGIELFGIAGGLYLALACAVAYLFSGPRGIYSAQVIGSPKRELYSRWQNSWPKWGKGKGS